MAGALVKSQHIFAHLNLGTATDDCYRRTQFTDQDENNLCDWIATKIPYKETGGRTGNRLYQQLCDLVSLSHIAKGHNVNVCNIEWRPRICLGYSSYMAILERKVQEKRRTSRQHHRWDRRTEKASSGGQRTIWICTPDRKEAKKIKEESR